MRLVQGGAGVKRAVRHNHRGHGGFTEVHRGIHLLFAASGVYVHGFVVTGGNARRSSVCLYGLFTGAALLVLVQEAMPPGVLARFSPARDGGPGERSLLMALERSGADAWLGGES
jgi:hypothetical protein